MCESLRELLSVVSPWKWQSHCLLQGDAGGGAVSGHSSQACSPVWQCFVFISFLLQVQILKLIILSLMDVLLINPGEVPLLFYFILLFPPFVLDAHSHFSRLTGICFTRECWAVFQSVYSSLHSDSEKNSYDASHIFAGIRTATPFNFFLYECMMMSQYGFKVKLLFNGKWHRCTEHCILKFIVYQYLESKHSSNQDPKQKIKHGLSPQVPLTPTPSPHVPSCSQSLPPVLQAITILNFAIIAFFF